MFKETRGTMDKSLSHCKKNTQRKLYTKSKLNEKSYAYTQTD